MNQQIWTKITNLLSKATSSENAEVCSKLLALIRTLETIVAAHENNQDPIDHTKRIPGPHTIRADRLTGSSSPDSSILSSPVSVTGDTPPPAQSDPTDHAQRTPGPYTIQADRLTESGSPESPILSSPGSDAEDTSPPALSALAGYTTEDRVTHSTSDGVLTIFPTMKQWNDFPTLLDFARDLDAPRVGVFKVKLPSKLFNRNIRPRTDTYKGWRYSAGKTPSGVFSIFRERARRVKDPLEESDYLPKHQDPFEWFEGKLHDPSWLSKAYYCTDLEAQTAKARERLGLPRAPILPTKGDLLALTPTPIPGLHSPYAYYGENYVPFACHEDDVNLFSINLLWTGEKHGTGLVSR